MINLHRYITGNETLDCVRWYQESLNPYPAEALSELKFHKNWHHFVVTHLVKCCAIFKVNVGSLRGRINNQCFELRNDSTNCYITVLLGSPHALFTIPEHTLRCVVGDVNSAGNFWTFSTANNGSFAQCENELWWQIDGKTIQFLVVVTFLLHLNE